MGKQKQKEFDNMPAQSLLGKKALEMIGIREEMCKMNKKLEEVRAQLVEEFVKEGKTQVRVEGHLITYLHVENDKIIIKHGEKAKKE